MGHKVKVHLMSQGVLFERGETSVVIPHPTFDNLAEQVAEAALNKKGYETVRGTAEDIRAEDRVFGMEVMNVMYPHKDSPIAQLTFVGMDELLVVNVSRILKIERPIS